LVSTTNRAIAICCCASQGAKVSLNIVMVSPVFSPIILFSFDNDTFYGFAFTDFTNLPLPTLLNHCKNAHFYQFYSDIAIKCHFIANSKF
jgi:hypothetical protein